MFLSSADNKNKVDLLTGGFPCQAFSYAGKKLGFNDTRGTLFYEFARAVKETNPKVILAENVKGLVSHNSGKTLETIKDIIRDHLKKKKGKVFGQCLTAVGWVGGTLPKLFEKDGMIELSMADVAGGGIVVGSALMNEKPIYVIRYQGFNWYNAPMIVNYAAKSKELWNTPCPIFVRGIGMEGAIGPVAGSSHHSLYYSCLLYTSPSPRDRG